MFMVASGHFHQAGYVLDSQVHINAKHSPEGHSIASSGQPTSAMATNTNRGVMGGDGREIKFEKLTWRVYDLKWLL